VGLVKRFERAGRRLLVFVLSVLLGRRRRSVNLDEAPRILVVRLDERVGNLLLLTPLLSTLKLRYPKARVELLGSIKGQRMMAGHPAIDRFFPFRKKALFAGCGPLRMPFTLHRQRYDLAIDAANPTDPSATQAIMVRLCGARHTIGADHADFGRLFTAPVGMANAGPHEIDLRLALLNPLPEGPTTREVTLPCPAPLPKDTPAGELLDHLANTTFAVVNVGARLASKTLAAPQYAALCRVVRDAGLQPVVTYGPKERELAEAVTNEFPGATLAPPTDLIELGALLAAASRVVTVDTGPMHLAVAMGTPTCGLFVNTEPERYGYAELPHMLVDVRERFDDAALVRVKEWLDRSGA